MFYARCPSNQIEQAMPLVHAYTHTIHMHTHRPLELVLIKNNAVNISQENYGNHGDFLALQLNTHPPADNTNDTTRFNQSNYNVCSHMSMIYQL